MKIITTTEILIEDAPTQCLLIELTPGLQYWYQIWHGNSSLALTLSRIKSKKYLKQLEAKQ